MRVELLKAIEDANKQMTSMDIKGKDYVLVNQRVKAFRLVYPDGKILTNMASNENGVCVFRAEVYDGDGKLLATGTAYEKENGSFINKTSYIENCETSAIGRALGFCGFGIDASIASYEEVSNAMLNQKKKHAKTNKATNKAPAKKEENATRESMLEYLVAMYKEYKENVAMYIKPLLKANNVKVVSDLNNEQLTTLYNAIKSNEKGIKGL
jgi:hypothetical protein